MNVVQFLPFDTCIEYGFWDQLCHRKLNDWKLDETVKPVVANYINDTPPMVGLRLSLSHDAFLKKNDNSRDLTNIDGDLLVFNTIDGFTSLDRSKLATDTFARVRNSILTGSWLNDPSNLNTFVLTVYADLKKYRFHYWNCIPTIIFPKLIWHRNKSEQYDSSTHLIDDYLTRNNNKPFVLINGLADSLECLADKNFDLTLDGHLIVFPDPSNKYNVPGWPMRNFIAALSFLRKDISKANILCYRKTSESFILQVEWKVDMNFDDCKSIVGWDRNSKGQLRPNFVDLASSMDPTELARESVELNLRLMKWRLMPHINLDRYTNLKCLILGCGTLGCNISRSLLGYGVRNITFVDYGEVSYSNPARQTLFDFSDARKSDRKKAEAAAEALRRIYPFINANGVVMKIPMPGHSVSPNGLEEANVASDVSKLVDLIQSCDVLFLCTDSRESRWLPTLLASAYNKLAISVALGFDSYSVIRHGVSAEFSNEEEQPVSSKGHELLWGSMLGCYFCSDVTAPGDSISDRTLDRQCTVSRAGISMTASGIAVELLSAVIQHPKGGQSPASLGEPDQTTTVLGATPHQIRGSFLNFKQITPTVKRFPNCVACGPAVISAYNENGIAFLLQAFNNPKHLEKLAGLDAFHANDVELNLFEYDSDNSSI